MRGCFRGGGGSGVVEGVRGCFRGGGGEDVSEGGGRGGGRGGEKMFQRVGCGFRERVLGGALIGVLREGCVL